MQSGSLRVGSVHTLGVLVANLPSAFHPFKYGCGGERDRFLLFGLQQTRLKPSPLEVLVEATA